MISFTSLNLKSIVAAFLALSARFVFEIYFTSTLEVIVVGVLRILR